MFVTTAHRVVQATSANVASHEAKLAEAYWRLGQALAAEPPHPDRQHAASIKVYIPCACIYMSACCCLIAAAFLPIGTHWCCSCKQSYVLLSM